MGIGQRIGAARRRQRLRQRELAAAVGVSPRQVRFWESETDEPSSKRIANLAGALGVSVGWLLTGNEEGKIGEYQRVVEKDGRYYISVDMLKSLEANAPALREAIKKAGGELDARKALRLLARSPERIGSDEQIETVERKMSPYENRPIPHEGLAAEVLAEWPVVAALVESRLRSPVETMDEGPPPGKPRRPRPGQKPAEPGK